ncbi:MAG TPA: hypothetical protein VGL65_00545 [Gemmatimonadales bacterium]|jgi:hypothetical protein
MVVAGLGLGLAIGFVLGELAGPLASRSIRRGTLVRAPRPVAADLVRRAHDALDGDATLGQPTFEIVAVRSGAVEVHGWVADRRTRANALRRVAAAVHPAGVIDCLRVIGEDDEEPSINQRAARPRLA